MASTWRRVTASVVLVTGSAIFARSAAAQTAPSLTVVVHDHAALTPAVLERARTVATAIYRQADVQLTWWDADRFDAAMETTTFAARPVSPASVIHVRLLRSSATDPLPADGDLGFAISGSQLASVLIERVEHVASHSGRDLANLLGHVMAHEMGHLLLPPNSHSAAGVMAATMDLFLVEHGGLSFDQRQATMIRARVVSMSHLQ